jgi:hypothetical protein
LEPRFLNFGASCFFIWGLCFVWPLHWNRKQKKRFGPGYLWPRILNFGAWRFLRTLGSLGPRAETGNKKNREQKKRLGSAWWASLFKFWGPRVFWGTWAL